MLSSCCIYLALSRLILLLVKEKVFLAGVVGPDVLDAFVDLAFVLNLLKVLDNLEGSPRTDICRSCPPKCFGR